MLDHTQGLFVVSYDANKKKINLVHAFDSDDLIPTEAYGIGVAYDAGKIFIAIVDETIVHSFHLINILDDSLRQIEQHKLSYDTFRRPKQVACTSKYIAVEVRY